MKQLLLNCKQLKRTEFRSLDYFADENDNNGDELLNILTQYSPNSLTAIIISKGWKYSIDAFEQFFESCRKRTLNFFGIYRYDDCSRSYVTEDHKAIVEKYVKEGVILHYFGL